MKKFLGIELGSTRIKSVLTDERGTVIAKGIFDWENKLVRGLWSYDLDEALRGLAESYKELSAEYAEKTGETLKKVDAVGISGMMHGYLALDAADRQVGIFQTWRNTHTEAAATELSELFRFNVPQRWSVAQYYQAVLSGEDHVRHAAKLFTLAGYVHYRLTGNHVSGVGEASGMFPVNGNDYDGAMIEAFDRRLAERGLDVRFRQLLPKIQMAGEIGGYLTPEGAKLIDPSGELLPGAPLCPPEGDIQTNMVCANSIAAGAGNVSAGTSCNLVAVLDKLPATYSPDIDIVSTPDGLPAAMIHSNNCTSEINAWINLFGELTALFGREVPKNELFRQLFRHSLESDGDVGGLVGYNYLAGEAIAGCETGALTVSRNPSGKLSLANFMQMQIYSALGALSLGVDNLRSIGANIRFVTAAGGYYKTEFVGQNATSSMFGVPVTVMAGAGEGGPWGMALLAIYMFVANGGQTCVSDGANGGQTCVHGGELTLARFLDDVFADVEKTTVMATQEEIDKCRLFTERYKKCLDAQRRMTELIR